MKKYLIELKTLEKIDREIEHFYSIEEVTAAKALEGFRKWFISEFIGKGENK